MILIKTLNILVSVKIKLFLGAKNILSSGLNLSVLVSHVRVKVFKVTGLMKIRREWQKFSLEIADVKKENAIERVYSLLGSRHKLKRAHIRILEVKEINLEEIRNPRLRELMSVDRIVLFTR